MAQRTSVVRSQMPRGSVSLTGSPGEYDAGRAPFTRKHDLGNGGIPLKFREDIGAKEARTVLSKRGDTGNPAISAPSAQGGVRPRARASVPSNRK